MKLRCVCDHVIRDQTDSLPYKARLLPDMDEAALIDRLSAVLAELVDLAAKGRRPEWIEKYLGKGYPGDLDDASMIYDYLSAGIIGHSEAAYQCENCGRLLIFRGAEAEARFFRPEGEWRGTLSRIG